MEHSSFGRGNNSGSNCNRNCEVKIIVGVTEEMVVKRVVRVTPRRYFPEVISLF